MSEINPWKLKSSRAVYSNSWISLREDQVITPSGENGIYSVVETKPAIGVVALTTSNEVYLVGQYRYPTENYSWEIIEGGGEKGETHLESAKRELREEAGLLAKNWAPLGGEVHLSNSHSDEKAWFFIAKDLKETEKDPDPTELLKIKKIPLVQALDLVNDGLIVDAMSIIALNRLAKEIT